MTTTTDLLRRAADILAALADPGRAVCGSISDISADAASLLALADQMERAEPVAWVSPNTGAIFLQGELGPCGPSSPGWKPLYAHPAPEVQRDAERYRWLRDEIIQDARDVPWGIAVLSESPGGWVWAVTYEEDADDAIDAAMQEPKP